MHFIAPQKFQHFFFNLIQFFQIFFSTLLNLYIHLASTRSSFRTHMAFRHSNAASSRVHRENPILDEGLCAKSKKKNIKNGLVGGYRKLSSGRSKRILVARYHYVSAYHYVIICARTPRLITTIINSRDHDACP